MCIRDSLVTATLLEVEGRKLTFSVVASDSQGKIGEGTHIRLSLIHILCRLSATRKKTDCREREKTKFPLIGRSV